MRRHFACATALITVLLLLLDCQLVLSAGININYTDRGWYNVEGHHAPTNINYLVGDDRGSCQPSVECLDDYHNFFVFDLANLTRFIESAKLALSVPDQPQLGYVSVDLSENYELHDVTTPIASLVAGTGGLAAHTDLGSGIIYGSRTMTAADNGSVVEIELNASALSAMNANHGLFAIGGSLTTLDSLPDNEYTFAATTYFLTTQLRNCESHTCQSHPRCCFS